MMSLVCAIPVIASLFSCGGAGPLAVGYVEGEYVLVAPIETAQIVDLAVRRGDRVTAGKALARRPLLWPRLWVPSSVGRPEAHWAERFRIHLSTPASGGQGRHRLRDRNP